MWIRSKLFLLSMLLVTVSAGFALVWSRAASSQIPASVDWISGTPTVTKIADLESAPVAKNRDCNMTNLQVARGFSAPFEQHCMITTAMGLLNDNGDVVQPNNYSKAYPLVNTAGGNPVTLPIPNQPAALSLTGTGLGNGTSYLALYRNLHSNLQFELLPYPRYRVIQQAGDYFRYDDGAPVRFNYNTMTYPQNGRYFIVDTTQNGFMKVDLLNLTKRPIADSLPFFYTGNVSNSANAIDNSGRFVAIAFNSPGEPNGSKYFKLIDTASCSGGFNAISNVKPVYSCSTTDMRPKLAQSIPNLHDVFNIRFVNDRTITFTAGSGTAATGYKYAKYTMVAGNQNARLTDYLAVGDSYISGEGAYSYRAGTDTERNGCHQSLLSYPYLLAQSASSFASVACSGAKMRNIVATEGERYFQLKGGEPTPSEQRLAIEQNIPGIVLQNNFIINDNPSAVTISIGGNDIGFGDILRKCIDPTRNLKDNLITHHTCYATYEDRLEVVNTINDKMPKLRQLYRDMRNSGGETRRVYVIGYPQVAKVGGNCGLNVAMNANEVQFAHDLIRYLNRVIKQAADEAGVQYVDTQASFDGFRLCEGSPQSIAINGFTVDRNSYGKLDVTASFHPNKTGHRLLATTIASQTEGLTKAMPEPIAETASVVTDPSAPILQNAPVTQRPVRKVQMMESKEVVVEKGTPLDMVVNGREYYTKPGGVYNVVMQSTPIDLGSFTANADGDLTIAPTVPNGVEPGFHTVHVYGNDIFGGQIDLQQVVYVAASAGDYDGDAVANATDSCVLTAQSGVDMDVDGVDDACDPLVTMAPTMPPDPEGIIWRDDAVLALEIEVSSGQGQ